MDVFFWAVIILEIKVFLMEVTISTRIYTVSKSLYMEELPVASLIQCHMMDSQPIENQSILSSTCFRLF